ncbi:arylamine N-acetyltransferase family protein [Brevibacterium zhoupengii]|uniref:arylamine N-acetyltransferase family protein n=1 Tax=Brevibacterium zhoupengii TaxID=2898795 RepID=UPI001E52ACAC|nr:arylamine N-acetyltransferase [Brevibacterium zhoupengii]
MTHPSLLSRYAKRLGLSVSVPELRRRAQGSRAQIVDLLDEILVAHTHAICFENLDVTAFRARGDLRAVAIDVDGAADKLLTDGRGGYCHEHAALIRGVVTELGLSAHPILARVHLGDRQTAPGALTHQATIVDLDGRRFLIDPGFGGGTPEAALELGEAAAARMTPHGEHRLVPARTALVPELRADGDWVLQSRTRDDQEFHTVYAFSEAPRQQMDLELANWFSSTKPGSRFTGPPILALPLPDGGRVTLEGRRLRRTIGGARPDRQERTLADATDFAEVLADDFGLDLDKEFTDLVWGATVET